jgi:copper resistance protein B
MSMRRSLIHIALAAATLVPAAASANDLSQSAPWGSPIEDRRAYLHVMLNQLEGRFGASGNSFRWEGEAWAGTDRNRLWLKSEGEVAPDGSVEDGQQEVFYDRPITTYFDLQAGVRSDIDSAPGRTWAAFGIQGLAPYFFEVGATAYASSSGHYAAKLEVSYDQLLTQRLILQPQIEMNFYTKNDPARGVGSGLSDIDTGLRLRYEISRKFAPYVGVAYAGKFGPTRRLARAAGERSDDLRFVAGVRTWF